MNSGVMKASEEIPTNRRSTPHAATQPSDSTWPASFSTTTSDAVHVYSTPPAFSFLKFSSTHRFPDDATAKAQRFSGRFSQMTSAAYINTFECVFCVVHMIFAELKSA